MEWLQTLLTLLIGAAGSVTALVFTFGNKWVKLRRELGELKLKEAQGQLDLDAARNSQEDSFYNRRFAEYEREITRMVQQIAAHETQADSMRARLDELHNMHIKCLSNEELSKARLLVLENQIAQLQKIVTSASVQLSTTVVGDVETGMVVDADESVKEILGWDRTDLIGKPIDVLIPKDIQFRHHKGLERSRLSGQVRPPEIAIQSYAQRRDGERIPVVVSLNNYNGPDGKLYVAAQIMHRKVFSVVDVTSGSHEHNPLPGADRRVVQTEENPGRRKEDQQPPISGS